MQIWLPGPASPFDPRITRAAGYDDVRSLLSLQRQMERLTRERFPHWDGPGTSFAGSEALAALDAASAAVANSAAEGSLLPRGQVGPFDPRYWGAPNKSFRIRAQGVAATTVTPTILFKVKQNTVYANPIAGAILAGSIANTATATRSGVVNGWWLIDVLCQVRATGNAGTILCVGALWGDLFTATTGDVRLFSNANPPTNVTEDLTLSQYLDLTATWGTANAANTAQCLAYLLESLN